MKTYENGDPCINQDPTLFPFSAPPTQAELFHGRPHLDPRARAQRNAATLEEEAAAAYIAALPMRPAGRETTKNKKAKHVEAAT